MTTGSTILNAMSLPDDGAAARAPKLLLIDPGGAATGPIRVALERMLLDGEMLVVDDGSVADGTISTEELHALPAARWEPIRVVMGVFPFGIDARWDEPARYGALLREPLARIAALHESRRHLARGQRRGHVSLEDLVFEQQHLSLDNGQTRLIAGRRFVPFGGCDESLLEEAIANIETRFDALLVIERSSRSMQLLASVLDIELDAAAAGDEVVTEALEPDSATAPVSSERIRDLNRFDLRLYRYVCDRLDAAGDAAAA